MINSHKFTLAGCLAILLWSTIVGLIRNVAEQLGPIGGAAMIYTVSSVFLLIVLGAPKLKSFPPRYLLIGGGLFVSYEICLSLALGMANNRTQAVEMGVINYLWPSLTVLLAVFISGKPVNKLLYPAIALSFFGVAWTVGGDDGISISQLTSNIATNPASYSMAFFGAFIWALYCNITKKLANGMNGITWFFIGTAIALWIKYLISNEPTMVFTTEATFDLLLAGIVMGSGYALWNIGIIGGNMVFLATLSYFTPILSTFFSAMILNIDLTTKFWEGVMMVTIASLICWWLTREKSVIKVQVKSNS
ncbi:Transporter, drug/metabolite exporter family [Moritella viscosa]|uniref:aromatic amino acid DMT transporter YddG n=1 Tax=Moritella viscosa TaxID=80854 RepID=UPI000508EDD0|nr:aromatic amino acid DMT transporter YddG [Moritella viscosa]CED59412.1 membrane protein [Moritella viscosa]SHO01473.1 Transporter, drug/metabolite exporter family [Moritella viscosa]SHO20511.1 Transporter, drug/metabolite exporter family [Moritella viscosa]